MVDTTTRPVRRASALAVMVLACALSLAVGVATPANADASTLIGDALDVGETLAAPEEIEAAAPVCLAGPAGAALCAGVLVAGAAIATSHYWLPMVKGWFSSPTSTTSGTSTIWAVTASLESDGRTVDWNAAQLTRFGDGRDNVNVVFASSCVANGIVGTMSQPFQVAAISASGSGSAPMCPVGSTVASGTVQATNAYFRSDTAVLTGAIPDASASQKATLKCVNPDGSEQTVEIDATGAGAADKMLLPSCTESAPGSWPESLDVKGGWSGSEQPLVHVDYAGHADAVQKYPDCFGSGGSYLNTCRVRVWINGQPCVNGMAGCYDPKTYEQDNPGTDVKCQWGPYVVAWDDCAPLRHHYSSDPATQTTTVTTVDPTTGQPITDPTVGTGTGTAQQPIPSTGDNPATSPSPSSSTDTSSSDCWGTGWSWNPVSWVVIPVKCSLTWAFVPTDAPSFSDVPDPVPAGWLPSLPSMSSSACGPVTMPRLDFGFDGLAVGPVTIFDSCKDPWPLVRTFTYNGLLALLLVTVVWQGFRAVTSGVGAGVTIGGGGEDE